MVVVMRCPLNVMMMVYGLCWACLWYTSRSPVHGSYRWNRRLFVGLVVVVMMVVVTCLVSTKLKQAGEFHVLMMGRMMVVVLVTFSTTAAGGCASSISTFNVENTIFIFNSFGRLSALLRTDSLEPHHVTRFGFM